MRSLLIGQLRHRRGRAFALFLGILVATTGFTVLTGSTTTARLHAVGTVDANYRAAYDILVRPKGSRSALEVERGLVRPNYLSGLHGGISLDAYDRIKRMSGIAVAAPIAMVGYTTTSLRAPVDVTDAIDRSKISQTLRLRPRWSGDRGLTTLDDDAARIVHVTSRPIAWPAWGADGRFTGHQDGRDHAGALAACGPGLRSDPVEIQDDGTGRALCLNLGGRPGASGLDSKDRRQVLIAQLLPNGTFDLGPTFPTGEHRVLSRLTAEFEWPMSFLLAAIDPEQETELVGLGAALSAGRYLAGGDTAGIDDLGQQAVPVIAPDRPALDEQLVVTTDQVPETTIAGLDVERAFTQVESASGRPVAEARVDAAEVYGSAVAQGLRAQLTVVVQSGSPEYEKLSDGTLRPRPIPVDRQAVWGDNVVDGLAVPWFARDAATRPLTKLVPGRAPGELVNATAVGVFDPTRLRGFSELSAVPLETYHPPMAAGDDDASRALLGGKPLVPNSNPGGYLATPPMMLTSLSALPTLLGTAAQAAAPISAVRVRVDGVTGMDAVSQERVRLAAEAIHLETGLEVDITIGASPAPQRVELGAGDYGRPELRLVEDWSSKGVAVAVIQAVDHKTAVLVALILVVCVLFLFNAVSAAVRDRRRELATLACLGWPPRKLFQVLVGEVAAIGLAAGVVSVGLAAALSSLGSLTGPSPRVLLAVPVALGLSVIAALIPAVRAARTHPGAAMHAIAVRSRRSRAPRRRTIASLAVANLWRTPGRTFLGAAALAIGVAGVTALVAVLQGFHGAVVGSLLGEAVSVQVRAIDLVAVGAVLVLGVAAVADVLYVNVRERAAEIATLLATGWRARTVARMIAYEGVGMGVLGAILGTVAGLAVISLITGSGFGAASWTAVGVGAGGSILLAALAASVPAWIIGRAGISDTLGEE